MAVSATVKIEARLDGVWTDISADVLVESVSIKYGIDGDGPTDVVASTGELHFGLRNDAQNSGATLGWYSPASASCRAGWGFGINVRASFTSGAHTDVVRFYGKIRVIAPLAGSSRGRTVDVIAYDAIRDLAETDAREVETQENQTESQLLTAILAAVPAEAQPLAVDFDAGVDSYPIAFDNVAGGAKALALIRDVVVSSLGMFAVNGDGTARYRSRHALSLGASAVTFDNDMADLSVPSSLDKVYNRFRSTTHPKTVTAAATEVLYTLPASNPITLSPGATVVLWTDYSDPLDRQTKIGGIGIVTTLVAGTHYAGNAVADGSGANLSGSLSASLDPFSSTAKWTITNTHASATVYLTALQVIGKAVRDPGPQSFEATTTGASDRPIEFDLPYQDDPYVGQAACDYMLGLYSSLTSHVEAVEFSANRSAEFMTAALTVEPGDRVTISESVTGLASLVCIVRSVELRVGARGRISCRFGLKPASTAIMWILGEAGASELGETTLLGF